MGCSDEAKCLDKELVSHLKPVFGTLSSMVERALRH